MYVLLVNTVCIRSCACVCSITPALTLYTLYTLYTPQIVGQAPVAAKPAPLTAAAVAQTPFSYKPSAPSQPVEKRKGLSIPLHYTTLIIYHICCYY